MSTAIRVTKQAAELHPVRQTVFGQIIKADSLMKIARLSYLVCGGLVVIGGYYVLYSALSIEKKQV